MIYIVMLEQEEYLGGGDTYVTWQAVKAYHSESEARSAIAELASKHPGAEIVERGSAVYEDGEMTCTLYIQCCPLG